MVERERFVKRTSKLWKKVFSCLAVPLAVLALGGCYNGQLRIDGRSVDDLAVPGTTVEMQQADVPVPRGFTLMPNDSYAYTDGFRSVSLVYHAPDARVEDTAGFYLNQMRNSNWILVRDVGTNTRLLFFEKDRQECVVLIQSKGFAARLQVDIHPQRT